MEYGVKKIAIKKPSNSDPSVWEWKTHMPMENSTYVGLVYFDTIEQAQAAATEWGEGCQLVEVNVPD